VSELAGLLIAAVALAALVTLAPVPVNRVLWRIETSLSLVSAALILFAMLFVVAEVVLRNPFTFNSPIPGHLELSELLMPAIIYLAFSYNQGTGGNVRMTLAIDALSPRVRRAAEIAVNVLSIGVCAVLAYYSGKHAWRAFVVGDVTMSPPYYVVWPAALMAPVGLTLVSLRLYLETLRLVAPRTLPGSEPGLASLSITE
jgi:TRAP-type C4-dicarboxylate transport system permease small subunit